MLHPRCWVSVEGVKLPIRIRRRSHGVLAEDQSLDGHHPVDLAAWPGEVVESRCPVIFVAPCGGRMDLEEVRVVPDAHHGAHGEGVWPGIGKSGWAG